jgi:VWFA-related protein
MRYGLPGLWLKVRAVEEELLQTANLIGGGLVLSEVRAMSSAARMRWWGLVWMAVCVVPAYAQQAPGPTVTVGANMPAVTVAAAGAGAGEAAASRDGDGSGGGLFLDVVVTDSAGHPVKGLPAQDFTLLEDGHAALITSFRDVSGGSAPGAAASEAANAESSQDQVVFLLDGVNLSFLEISQARTALSALLRRNGGKLVVPTSILMLTDKGVSRSGDPTEDGNSLAADLDKAAGSLRAIGRSAGFYGGLDRLGISYRALDLLAGMEAKQPGRKLLVWISEGWPYLASPGVTYTNREQQQYFDTAVNFSTLLRASRVVLYNVDPRGASSAESFQHYYYRGFTKGLRKEVDAQAAYLGLQVLAVQSGGLVENSSNNVAAEMARCLDDVGVDYEMTSAPLSASEKIEYHTIEVKVNQPGLKVRTRTGYYTRP